VTQKNYDDILDYLESKIDEAVSNIASLRRMNKELMEEKKKLQSIIESKDSRIEGLQKKLHELEDLSENELLARYKKKEEILRSRIKTMLARLDELRDMG